LAPTIELSDLIAALSRPEAYPHPVGSIEVHQTHISVVFLAGPFAYKIKKPVELGFLDFSTLEKRKHYCEEEVRLNRRLAPHVYLGVVPITSSETQARVGGEGRIIEWAVQMKRLPAEATLEQHVLRGEVTEMQIRMLAQRIAAFHHQADSSPRISSFGRFHVVATNARENFTQAEALVGVTVSPIVFERTRDLTEAHLARHCDLIEARAAANMPRDAHGDLHLDHVYLFPNEAPPHDLVMIDCVEFNDRFRFADPIADMAFLAMDLKFHGRRDLARLFTDAYFQASGDGAGRSLLPYYSAYRAVIRAKVEGMELGEMEIDPAERCRAEERARAHWLLALGELEEPAQRPALLIVAGLPGSGKSTLAQALAREANVEVLRSDVLRKELTASARSENTYTDDWTAKTYAELLRRTEGLFWQGKRVLIDANFRDDDLRRRFLDAGKRWCVPAVLIQCRANPAIIRQRLDARRGDVSDADWRVYQELQSAWQPLSGSVRQATMELDTSGQVANSLQTVRARLVEEGLL
jgi:aminoglycoside phosphotransferase family enzyme/predicted kinase